MIENIFVGPTQPFAVGVMVTTPVIVAVVVFAAVKAGTLVVPLATNPMAVLLLAQTKVVPATGPIKVVGDVVTPLQYI